MKRSRSELSCRCFTSASVRLSCFFFKETSLSSPMSDISLFKQIKAPLVSNQSAESIPPSGYFLPGFLCSGFVYQDFKLMHNLSIASLLLSLNPIPKPQSPDFRFAQVCLPFGFPLFNLRLSYFTESNSVSPHCPPVGF